MLLLPVQPFSNTQDTQEHEYFFFVQFYLQSKKYTFSRNTFGLWLIYDKMTEFLTHSKPQMHISLLKGTYQSSNYLSMFWKKSHIFSMMYFIGKSKKKTLIVLVFALKIVKVAIFDYVKIPLFWTKTAYWARYLSKFIIQRAYLVEGI